MTKKQFQFRVPATHPAAVEMSEEGIYVGFQAGIKAAKTIIRSEWSHVALDLAEDDSVIGIECTPAPEQFTVGAIARKAVVSLAAGRMDARSLKISSPGRSESFAGV
jgi:hypothetical protein